MCVPVQRWLERVHAAADRHRRMLQLVLVAHFQPGDQRAPRVHALGVCVSLPARQIAECEWVERAAQVRLRPAVVQCSTYRQSQWGWLLVRLFREGFTFRSTGPGQGQGNRARDIGSMAGRGPPERTVDASPSCLQDPLNSKVAYRIPSTQKLLTGSPRGG